MASNRSGYGTAPTAAAAAHQGNGFARDGEEQPLLGGAGKPSRRPLRKLMTAEVSRSWADLVLLLCYVVTGLLDSASTQVWGAFVSMQTG